MLNRLDPAIGAFVLRLSLGVMLIAHGLLKVLVFTIPGTVGYFTSLGLPAIAAYATLAIELIGGLAMIVGFQVRAVAAITVPVLLGAAIFGHGGNGWVFSNPNGGWEYPVFLAAAAVAQVFLGAGAFALGGSASAEARLAAAVR